MLLESFYIRRFFLLDSLLQISEWNVFRSRLFGG